MMHLLGCDKAVVRRIRDSELPDDGDKYDRGDMELPVSEGQMMLSEPPEYETTQGVRTETELQTYNKQMK